MKTTYLIAGIAMACIIALLIQGGTAYTTDVKNTSSNATINKQIAMGLSAELTSGIAFGDLNPDTENNADSDNGANNAITTDSANNVNIDLCIRANANLSKTDTVTIGMLNYTWWDNSSAGVLDNGTTLSTTYQAGFNQNIGASTASYWGFWLDVPGGQAAGTYNNTIQFKAVETGEACGT